MPIVARRDDLTRCPEHFKGKILEGESKVIVCHKPIARKGDKVLCRDGSIDVIIEGDMTVIFGGQPVARKGDKTAHGGVIVTGCPHVWIGRRIRGICKLRAAKRRAAFIRYSLPLRRSLREMF